MKKKLKFGILLALAVVLTAIFLVAQSRLFSNFEPKVQAQTDTQIPSHVLYDQLFRLVVNFKSKAEIQRLKGENVTSLKDYFKDKARLSEPQSNQLERIATEYSRAVEPIDTAAGQILAQLRQQFPDGWVGEGKQVPPPPAELEDLQNQRNSLALRHRDNLRELLGTKDFENFDEFVQRDFAQNFRAIGGVPVQ